MKNLRPIWGLSTEHLCKTSFMHAVLSLIFTLSRDFSTFDSFFCKWVISFSADDANVEKRPNFESEKLDLFGEINGVKERERININSF